MAGHSKWANIKHKKERADAKKGKIFSRIVKEIISAVKMGGLDPKSNARLRLALQKAKDANVPKDVVEKNVKKASSCDQTDYAEVLYELYGHGGVGVLVEALTDNRNRTVSDLRIATHKRGGTIADTGAVAFNFDRRGILRLPKGDMSEDELFLLATEAGAEDFEVTEEGCLIVTDPQELYAVKEQLDEKDVVVEEATIEMIPKMLIDCEEKTLQSNMALIEWIEALDDVDAVYHNMSSEG
ncbi:YebC/PmpR family DNA-binding transcriptional regulator [Simkania negevensis]|uniref:Probable transcriptional regulatory protein JYU14_01460 n=1 Tax=Simkania negevensis TaxID=83561 RepID=A0ABS3AQW8_9BACT|nr:YebC/PmpR family DNA-binding transcriptional regulator [Simkania negevensis]